jgi:antitoxin Phd
MIFYTTYEVGGVSMKVNINNLISITDYSKLEKCTIAEDATVEEAANNILNKHLKTFEELAK